MAMAYDRAYRCQVVSNHRLCWSIEDPFLHNEALVGHTKKLIPRCRHCQSECHTSKACTLLARFMVPWGLAALPQHQVQTFKPIWGPNIVYQEVCRNTYLQHLLLFPPSNYLPPFGAIGQARARSVSHSHARAVSLCSTE